MKRLSLWTRTPFSHQNFANQNHCTLFRGGFFQLIIYTPLPNNNTSHRTIARHFLTTYITHFFLVHSITFLTRPPSSPPKKHYLFVSKLTPARGIKNRESGSYYCKSINSNLQAHTHIYIYENDRAFLYSNLHRPISTIPYQ